MLTGIFMKALHILELTKMEKVKKPMEKNQLVFIDSKGNGKIP